MSKHSTHVFSMFLRKHPGHDTALNDPARPCGTMRAGLDGHHGDSLLTIDDRIAVSVSTIGQSAPGDGEGIAILIGEGRLSPCQMSIVENFLYEDTERLPSFDGMCDMCMASRNADSCPRDGFKMTRAAYKSEMNDLGKMLIDLMRE